MVSLVLADPVPMVRDGLRALLAPQDEITVVAEAATGRDALVETIRHRPDVLVLDLERTELLAVGREVQRSAPQTAMLAFTDTHDDATVMAAIRAGIRGYLPKSAGEDDLVRAIRGLAGGQAIFGPHVAGKITEFLFTQRTSPFPELTQREREILDLMASGMTNAAIALRLDVATKTVRNHASTIFTKLGVTGRAEAVVHAHSAGLGRDQNAGIWAASSR